MAGVETLTVYGLFKLLETSNPADDTGGKGSELGADSKLLKFGKADVVVTSVILIGTALGEDDAIEPKVVGSGTRIIPSSNTTVVSCGTVLHRSTHL